jgi:HAE1 family hydrophobic/amphiphilic exporter-1
MLSARVIHVPGEGEKKSLFRRIYDAWERVWKSIERLYRSALRWALAHRSAVVTAAVSLLIASFAIPSYVGAEFAPKMDHGEMFINVTSPVGSSFAYTDGIARQIEKILKDRVPEVEHVTADVGIPPTGSMFSTSTVTIEKPDMCGINVSLKEKSQGRTRSVFTIQDELRPLLVRIPGADIRIQEVRGLSNKADLEVILKGYDLKVLASKGEELKKIVSYIPGAADLDLNWRSGNPEYRISLDRERAGEHGLNLGQVAAAVRTLILGENVTKYKEKGKEYDITLQLPSLQRQNIEDIQSIRIPAAGGAQVSLQDVADVTLQTGPSSISRRDRSRCVILQGNATGRSMGEIVAEIKEKIPSLSLPSGYRWAIEGQEKERDESFAKLWAALALGVLLVYVILASQFESFVHPFTIMLAIPLELVGVFLAMLIFREPMSIMIILGMIMLTGIVVSNSILLVNYIIVLRNSGKKRLEAVLEAGPVRLRPILMTALATVIAMVPMAMGLREGQEFFAPLGKVVIGGLLTSTFFTLLVVPVAYTLLDDVGRRLGLARKED